MKKYGFYHCLLIFYLSGLFQNLVIAQEPFQANWESLSRHKMPAWFDDAKIGLSMHWGVYAVPAWAPRETGISYAEWYGQNMHLKENPTAQYHVENYGQNFKYEDFIPMFKAESYNPDEWMKFAKNMGAKYIYHLQASRWVLPLGQQIYQSELHENGSKKKPVEAIFRCSEEKRVKSGIVLFPDGMEQSLVGQRFTALWGCGQSQLSVFRDEESE
jgi:hypothetical protein